MADEKIEVEWIATANKMMQTLDRMDQRFDKQDKQLQKLAQTSDKTANSAVGSFNQLEQVLRKNETALKNMAVGSSEFDGQRAKVERLREAYEKMKATLSGKTGGKQSPLIPDQKNSLADIESQLKAVESQLRRTASTSNDFKRLETVYGSLKKRQNEMLASLRELGKEAPVVAIDAAGSFNKLEKELKEAESALAALAIGTKEFSTQKAKVDSLRDSLKNAKKELQTIEPEVVALSGSFNRLEKELKENEDRLKSLRIGTKEFDEQRRKVDALRTSLQKAKGELTIQKKESPWPAIGSTMTAAAASAGVLAAALIRVSQAQREIVSKGADQAATIDKLSRQMQIQSGATDEERQGEMVQIVQQSSAAGVTADQGFRAATQLSGSGFADSVESGALTTILNTMQASSFKGEPEELVSAFAQALNAYGLEKTNDNLQAIAVASQSLFKQTDFQLTELSDFAKNASVFEGANIQINEALAGFTALREVLPAAESGTGLRNFVNKLQAGDLTAENADNLKRIGVDAGDVDFVGESLTDVLSTIRDATAQMGEADRNAALGKMFGTENVASARLLLQSVDRIRELQASQQNPEQFMRDRDTAASSIEASRNRIDNQQLLDMMPIAGKINELDLRNRAMDAETKAQQERLVAVGGAGALVAPFVPTANQATDVVARTRDETAGGRIGIGAVGETMAPGTGYLVNKLLDIFSQQRDEQIATRLAIQNLAPQAAQPAAPRPPAPAVRPKEAPLPAATAP